MKAEIWNYLNSVYLKQQAINAQRVLEKFWIIENGRKMEIPGCKLAFKQIAGTREVAIQAGLTKFQVFTMSVSDILKIAGAIHDIGLAPSTYAGIKGSSPWRKLYQHGKRKLWYINGTTLQAGEDEDTFPCMQCGLVLPERLITVDHQRPQSGGEVEAVTKVLRAMGLTKGDPSGAKGKVFQAAFEKDRLLGYVLFGIGAKPIPTRIGRSVVHSSTLKERYTLTNAGAIFLSLAVAAGVYDELAKLSMHSLLNLAPLCQSCNSSKGDKKKFP